jgi:hypothetical protein
MGSTADNHIQSRVSPYHKWVIKCLAKQGFGRNSSDVISKIIGTWIEDEKRQDWLRDRKLTYDQYETQAAPEAPSESAVEQHIAGVVLSYPKDRVHEDER